MAQWERAGPITQRSVDRNYSLLKPFSLFTTLGWWKVIACLENVFSLQNLSFILPLDHAESQNFDFNILHEISWSHLRQTLFLCQKLMCTDFTTILRPASGVLLQWRNRLARRTYKQYLPKRCGGCEFEPHLEHVFSSKYLSKSPWMIPSPHPVATVYVWQQFPCRIS